jgi:hypothetical protein
MLEFQTRDSILGGLDTSAPLDPSGAPF